VKLCTDSAVHWIGALPKIISSLCNKATVLVVSAGIQAEGETTSQYITVKLRKRMIFLAFFEVFSDLSQATDYIR